MQSRILNGIILVSLALFMLRSGTPRVEEGIAVTGAVHRASQSNTLSTVPGTSSGHGAPVDGVTHGERYATLARPIDPLDAGIPAILCATKLTYRSACGYDGVSSSRTPQTPAARSVCCNSIGAGNVAVSLAESPSRFHLRI